MRRVSATVGFIFLAATVLIGGVADSSRAAERRERQGRGARPAPAAAARSEPVSALIGSLRSGARLMYVSAHPDDEIAVGPLLARAAEFSKVIVVSLTDGGGGENRGGVKLEGSLGEARSKEMAASCKVLDAECRLLGFENEPPREVREQMRREGRPETAQEAIDRWRRSGRDPLAEVVKVVRHWKPDIILSFDAEQGFTLHHEHQAVGMLVAAAIRDAARADRFSERVGNDLGPWEVKRWYTAVNPVGYLRNARIPKIDEARVAERIDGKEQSCRHGKTYLEIAQEAMAQHVTQYGGDFLTSERKAIFAQEIGMQTLVLESSPAAKKPAVPRPDARSRSRQITAESLQAEGKQARTELTKLSATPLPSGVSAETLAALRAKRLGYNLQADNAALWEATARADDLAKVGPQGYAAAELISRGYIGLQYPPPNGHLPPPSAALEKKARAITLNEQAEPDAQIEAARKAHAQGRDIFSAPTGERLETWGPEQVADIARSVDVFIIQSERWLVEDESADKHQWCDRVLKWTAVLRKANPKCQIFIEIGRRLDRGGGTAAQWLDAYARLCQRDPRSFDGMYPFITRQDSDDPQQGMGALKQLLAWLRPVEKGK
jgi:LmbE family N-acetylglucosaminyl deacetylase